MGMILNYMIVRLHSDSEWTCLDLIYESDLFKIMFEMFVNFIDTLTLKIDFETK